MAQRKRRYGLDCQRVSVRLAQATHDRLVSLVPRGQRSAFVDRATAVALQRLAGHRDTGGRRAVEPVAPRRDVDGVPGGQDAVLGHGEAV